VSRLDEATIRDFIVGDYRRLVAGLTRLAGDRGTAEEAVQEAMARAWERSDRGEHIDSLTGWVAIVATNLLRSAFRRRLLERRARRELGHRPEDPAETQEIDAADDRLMVARAIEQLPQHQRAVAVLYYFADLPLRDIASGLHMSESAVKAALHRAREGLRAALGTQILEEDGRARP
jgi:RNA polymerase sigma-70 factor (ECF subfamily)